MLFEIKLNTRNFKAKRGKVTPRVTHPKQGGPVASPKQVVLLDEFLITVVAVEWFFTSVKPFMHSQVVLLDEFLVTVEL